MARGKPGQFGHILNAPWVWIPLALIFLAGLWDFRRWRKWVHLDLLVLLSFGISQAFFNAAEIDVSVPLYYPPLVYLLMRMLWIGFRGHGRDGGTVEGLRPSTPVWLMTTAVIGLIVLRLAGNLADSGVIDVGYAGVIGADKITDAKPIYDDSFPEDNPTGDTYGPANYFAYVPFELIFPWDGSWDDLPAAHAATIFFDLATVAGLFALGLALVRRRPARTRGRDETTPDATQPRAAGSGGAWRPGSPTRAGNVVGLILAFAWVAYPYTAFAMQGNSNDELISALLVWSLVAFASPFARGGAARDRLDGQVRPAAAVPALRGRGARDSASAAPRPPRPGQAARPSSSPASRSSPASCSPTRPSTPASRSSGTGPSRPSSTARARSASGGQADLELAAHDRQARGRRARDRASPSSRAAAPSSRSPPSAPR